MAVSLHLAIIHIAHSFGFILTTVRHERIARAILIRALFKQCELIRFDFGKVDLNTHGHLYAQVDRFFPLLE